MLDLSDQIAVVTGASSGVGRAIALGLAEQGVRLFLVGRQLNTLQEVAAIARAKSPYVSCYQADLAEDNDTQAFAKRVQSAFDGLDMLVHSAGVIELGHIGNARLDDLDRQYRINLRAPYALTQALLPMLRSRKGQIVCINSSVGVNARAGVGQYAATKHALKAIADTLRDEVNAEGLRVLSVFLGRTATPMQAAIHAKENRVYHPESFLQPEDVAAVVTNALRLPRTAEVTEIHIRPLRKPGGDNRSSASTNVIR
jgi:NADP-dependent 3-hydroxy acid dehydrogenase YdfG